MEIDWLGSSKFAATVSKVNARFSPYVSSVTFTTTNLVGIRTTELSLPQYQGNVYQKRCHYGDYHVRKRHFQPRSRMRSLLRRPRCGDPRGHPECPSLVSLSGDALLVRLR